MTKAHAKLSASGSERWLNCPGSINAESVYPDSTSVYAEEGTRAHELADICLKKRHDANQYLKKKILGVAIDKDMVNHVQEYLDYVLSHETENSILFTEEKVDFSNVVPDGFGTLDSGVLDTDKKICHIFDLKYGKGVPVDAFENTQGQMYAIGLYNELSWMGDIESFRIHIVQPRIQNISYWDISVKDLIKFAKFVSERANLALTENAPRVPGAKQCQWCKAKHDCKALAKFTEQIISAEFDDLDDGLDSQTLSESDKKTILDNKGLIISFLNSVEQDIYKKMLDGIPFKGYKLVEGRSNAVFTDKAEKFLVKKLGDDAYKKSLIGITEARKHLTLEEMKKITDKPKGKLTMVPDTDKRQGVVKTPIEDEFEEIE